jgi:hypothetical protein
MKTRGILLSLGVTEMATLVADSRLNYNKQSFLFGFFPVTPESKIIFHCRIEDLGLTPAKVLNDVGIARSTTYRMQDADTSKKTRIFIDTEVVFRLMEFYQLAFGELYEIYEDNGGKRGRDRLGAEAIYKKGQPYSTMDILTSASQLRFHSLLAERLKQQQKLPQQLFDERIVNRSTFYALEPERQIDRIDSRTATSLMQYFNCNFFDLFRMVVID